MSKNISDQKTSLRPINFLPDERRQGAAKLLPWVMAVMVYLSALSLMGVMLLGTGLEQWGRDLETHVTVQITENDYAKSQKSYVQLESLLKETVGIKSFRRFNDQEISALLEPWLGLGNINSDLPIPIMIDVELESEITINLAALEKKLQSISPEIHLDGHQQWLSDLNELTAMVRIIAMGVFFLVVMASISIIIFGTKAGMSEHKNTIKIVHILGATDWFIAESFQKRFFRYGMKGGIIGFVGALITILLLFNIVSSLSKNFVLTVDLPWAEIFILFLLPLGSALLSMITARFTVLRALKLML